jgi:trimeric autotransporter adhesin
MSTSVVNSSSSTASSGKIRLPSFKKLRNKMNIKKSHSTHGNLADISRIRTTISTKETPEPQSNSKNSTSDTVIKNDKKNLRSSNFDDESLGNNLNDTNESKSSVKSLYINSDNNKLITFNEKSSYNNSNSSEIDTQISMIQQEKNLTFSNSTRNNIINITHQHPSSSSSSASLTHKQVNSNSSSQSTSTCTSTNSNVIHNDRGMTPTESIGSSSKHLYIMNGLVNIL